MSNIQQQVAEYNQLVEKYHLLDKQIDDLLMKYGGHTENMPTEAMKQYRTLASRRDEAFNAMRTLEQSLFGDSDE